MTQQNPSAPPCAQVSLAQSANPDDLAIAVRVGQRMLTAYTTVDRRDVAALNQAYGGVSEALYILLRALGAEGSESIGGLPRKTTEEKTAPRCPAAHPDDPTPCNGPPAVTVLDKANAGANGCEHHGARLLASLDRGRVYGLPHAEPGTAIRVFKAAATIRPFAWTERGEGQ
jgi:hypothetical protein